MRTYFWVTFLYILPWLKRFFPTWVFWCRSPYLRSFLLLCHAPLHLVPANSHFLSNFWPLWPAVPGRCGAIKGKYFPSVAPWHNFADTDPRLWHVHLCWQPCLRATSFFSYLFRYMKKGVEIDPQPDASWRQLHLLSCLFELNFPFPISSHPCKPPPTLRGWQIFF